MFYKQQTQYSGISSYTTHTGKQKHKQSPATNRKISPWQTGDSPQKDAITPTAQWHKNSGFANDGLLPHKRPSIVRRKATFWFAKDGLSQTTWPPGTYRHMAAHTPEDVNPSVTERQKITTKWLFVTTEMTVFRKNCIFLQLPKCSSTNWKLGWHFRKRRYLNVIFRLWTSHTQRACKDFGMATPTQCMYTHTKRP